MVKKFILTAVVSLLPLSAFAQLNASGTAQADAYVAQVFTLQVDNQYLHFGTVYPDANNFDPIGTAGNPGQYPAVNNPANTNPYVAGGPSWNYNQGYAITNTVTAKVDLDPALLGVGIVGWALNVSATNDTNVPGTDLEAFTSKKVGLAGFVSDMPNYTDLTLGGMASHDNTINNMPNGEVTQFDYFLAVSTNAPAGYVHYTITYTLSQNT
jgi:hypothetical protein